MSRRAAPIPTITPVQKDLTVDEVRTIIDIAERAQARRHALTAAMKEALASGDQQHVNELARQLVGLEEEE